MLRFRRSGFVGGEGCDRCLMWEIGDRVLGGEGRSLFDVRRKAIGFCG